MYIFNYNINLNINNGCLYNNTIFFININFKLIKNESKYFITIINIIQVSQNIIFCASIIKPKCW